MLYLRKIWSGKVPKTSRGGGGAQQMGGSSPTFTKNGGSVDELGTFLGGEEMTLHYFRGNVDDMLSFGARGEVYFT